MKGKQNICFDLLRESVNYMEGQRLAQQDFGRYPFKQELQLRIEEYVRMQTGEENIYPDYLQEYNYGGKLKSNITSVEIDDIAWDIGLEKGWIKNGVWIDDSCKSKAIELARVEFSKSPKKGVFDGVNWIITGKTK